MFVPDPGSGIEKNLGSRIWNEYCASYFQKLRKIFFVLKILKFFDADSDQGSFDPGYGMEQFRSRINNLGQQHWSNLY